MISFIKHEPSLLTASFELDGELITVIIDTGATISFLPGDGKIMSGHKLRPIPTNLNVLLADESSTHIYHKIIIPLRPRGCREAAKLVPFYINKGVNKILGHDALLGLNALKLFNLSITSTNGILRMFYDGKIIGEQCSTPSEYKGSIRVDTRFENIDVNQQVSSILKRYRRVFTSLDQHSIKGQPMRIRTVHQRPVFAKPRHYSPDEIPPFKEHIDSLLTQGIISPTESGYSATSRLIKKASGAYRLVVNYIPLNAITIRDSYPLPQISDILGVLQGKKYFTTMDCSQGFYQILVDPRDRHKTAFSTPYGNFQFNRCPFGARNSCAVFQAEMNRIFKDGLYTRCVVYVDDIIVFGNTLEEHNDNLDWVLTKCDQYNVKLKLEKCCFAQEEVKYLGFLVSGNSIKPLQQKVDSLIESKPPKDKTELRSIIGKLNFYSRFIPNYSKQLEPLRELFKKNKDFQWRKDHQRAFEAMLDALKKAPPHKLVTKSAEKIIDIFVTNDSLEALLLDDNENLIHRMSRVLSASESNYSLTERELLSLVSAVNKFRIWLQPGRIKVRVSSNSLKKQFGLINRPDRVDNLLLRLPEGYDEFDFVMKESPPGQSKSKLKDHVPQEVYYIDGACTRNGKDDCKASWAICAEYDRDLIRRGFVEEDPTNQTAELTAAIKCCLLAKEKGQDEITITTDSRYVHSAATSWIDKWKNNEWKDHRNKTVKNAELFKQLIHAKEGLQIEWIHVKGHANHLGNIRADELARGLLNEKAEFLCTAMFREISSQEENGETTLLKQRIEAGKEPNMTIVDNIVYYIDKKLPDSDKLRKYVPTSHRKLLLELAHDNETYGGHLGIKKTHRKLIRYWWPKMRDSIEGYVKSCDVCQRFKNPAGPPPGYLKSIPVSRAFEHIHIDMVGPTTFTKRGNKLIITATDAFSKWAFTRPCQNIQTPTIIKFVEESIIFIHGPPETIITDRGTQFTSNEWKEFVDKYGIKHQMTTSFHPQANGIDERVNGTLNRILKAYTDVYQSDWDLRLIRAQSLYNTTVHESTGYSPYQLLFGMTHRSPLTSMKSDSVELKELETIRRKVREVAKENIREAQTKQAKNYDKHRKECHYKIGQKVWLKIHVVNTLLSKKLHPKWKGPGVITGFVGDHNDPKAIAVVDCENYDIKVVSLQDVKPFNERDNPDHLDPLTNNPSSKEKGGDDTSSSCDQNFNSPGYYLSDESGVANVSSASTNLDARRVTINDETQIYTLEPNQSNNDISLIDFSDIDQTLLVDVTSNNTSTTDVTQGEDTSKPMSNSTNTDIPSQSVIEQTDASLPRKSPYICDFIIDDSIRDPSYDPDVEPAAQSDRALRSATIGKQAQISVHSLKNAVTSSTQSSSQNDIQSSSESSTQQTYNLRNRTPISYNPRYYKTHLSSAPKKTRRTPKNKFASVIAVDEIEKKEQDTILIDFIE